jgi:cell division protein FtsL
MKGLGKIIIVIGFISGLFLLYVQGQISMLRVSYKIDLDSKKLARRSEEYRHLKFEVDQLKSPRRLEEKIKELELELTLPKEVRVVRVPYQASEEPSLVTESVELKPFSDGVLEFLGRWVKVAQAKTDS